MKESCDRNSRRQPKAQRLAEAGQSMVEVALLLPIFLGLVFAIIEIGRAWGVRHSLSNAAREGARILVLPYGAGLTYSSKDAVQQAAKEAVTSYLTSSGVPVGTNTEIVLVRVKPGNDEIYDTADDQYEPLNTAEEMVRGQRFGIQVNHNFETPLPLILAMFNNANSPTGIKMGISCYMEHE